MIPAWLVFTFHVLVAFGFWYAVGHSKISEPLRESWVDWHFLTTGKVHCEGCQQDLDAQNAWDGRAYRCPGCKAECIERPHKDPFLLQLIECPACLGFWEGCAFGLIAAPQVVELGGALQTLVAAPFFGLATLTTNLILAKCTKLMT